MASSTVRFTFEVTGSPSPTSAGDGQDAQLELVGTLKLSSVTGKDEPHEIGLDDEGPSDLQAVVRLPVDSSWTVQPKIEGYWAPLEILHVSKDSQTDNKTQLQVLHLWPLATLHGRVDPESEAGQQDALLVRFEPSPGKPGEPIGPTFSRSSVKCPIEEDGQWSCRVPSAKLDLSIQARGMIPHYFWGLQVSSNRPASGEDGVDLGTLTFVPGASLAGRVETEGGSSPEGKTEIRLVPRVAGGGLGLNSTAAQIQRVELSAEVDRRGFFQVVGIAPGSYVLEARHPGFATARMFPVQIFERAETRLKGPLVLRPPIDLTLQISPSLDWVTERWRVTVMQQSEFSAGFDERPIFDGQATRSGQVQLADQRPGIFSVIVEDSLGNRHHKDDHLVVEGSGSFTETIELDLSLVRGLVRYGDLAIPATVYFGGRHGSTRVRMEANSEGRFHGLLPRTGSWRVDVVAADPPLESELQVVVSTDSLVELEIPSTEVSGLVVRPDGKPVAGARVTRQGGNDSALSEADREGRFVFRGFEPGSVVLTARATLEGTEHFSDQVVEVVQEDQVAGPVRLILRHSVKPFKGRVMADSGPVAGAMVYVSPAEPHLSQSAIGSTDLQGWFEVDLAAEARFAQVTVLPPGYTLTTQLLALDTDAPTIQVARWGGDVKIVDEHLAGASEGPGQVRADRKLLLSEGLPIPWNFVFQWARGNGVALNNSSSGLLLPSLAPGNYSLCRLSSGGLSEALATGGSWQDAVQDCARGYLGAGDRLELVLSAE